MLTVKLSKVLEHHSFELYFTTSFCVKYISHYENYITFNVFVKYFFNYYLIGNMFIVYGFPI
jgi:hypothetical protein